MYCALDREYAEPILRDFERETGIVVRAKYDTESTKSVALAEEIRRESKRPRADVFWNNEILHTIRLADNGLLEPYASKVGREYPATVRDPEDRWFGFAARARVLLIHTELVSESQAPRRLDDLLAPAFQGKMAMAKPFFGTTATQMALLYSQKREGGAEDWLRRLRSNGVRILSGNRQVAIDVGAGRIPLGLTDSDDALAESRAGRPVRMLPHALSADGAKVLWIPNTIAVVRGAPHPAEARRLLDYVLSPAVEDRLAAGAGSQIPLHPEAKACPFPWGARLAEEPLDFAAAARAWPEAASFLRREFANP